MGSIPAEIEAALKDVPDDSNSQWTRKMIQSESPRHKVVLSQPIYLGAYEVTQAEYEKVMGKNPSHYNQLNGNEAVAGMDTTRFPVDNVSWNDAAECCAKLSLLEGHKPFYKREGENVVPLDGTGYQLPTEAEWEFACRAGTMSKFWSGDRNEDLAKAGWFRNNASGRTHRVGDLQANPFMAIPGSGCETAGEAKTPATVPTLINQRSTPTGRSSEALIACCAAVFGSTLRLVADLRAAMPLSHQHSPPILVSECHCRLRP